MPPVTYTLLALGVGDRSTQGGQRIQAYHPSLVTFASFDQLWTKLPCCTWQLGACVCMSVGCGALPLHDEMHVSYANVPSPLPAIIY